LKASFKNRADKILIWHHGRATEFFFFVKTGFSPIKSPIRPENR
jgi:hypothetical protein